MAIISIANTSSINVKFYKKHYKTWQIKNRDISDFKIIKPLVELH